MANLTVVVDDSVLRRARLRALEHGTSVNALLRDYLEAFAGEEVAEVALSRFLEVADGARVVKSTRTRWKRDDLYDRPVMRRG